MTIAANNMPGRIEKVLLIVNARASNIFHAQNRSSGNHNQLVVIFPMLTFPTPWLFNDHWTKRTRIKVIMKINSPRARLFCKNCPSPGTIREKSTLGVELVKDRNVFSEIVMKELF